MVLQGLSWLRQGRDVDVVSTHPDGLANSHMIQHQMEMTLRAYPKASPTPGTVRRHQYNFDRKPDVDRAISDLSAAVKDGTLCVLMDEADTIDRYVLPSLSLSLSLCISRKSLALSLPRQTRVHSMLQYRPRETGE